MSIFLLLNWGKLARSHTPLHRSEQVQILSLRTRSRCAPVGSISPPLNVWGCPALQLLINLSWLWNGETAPELRFTTASTGQLHWLAESVRWTDPLKELRPLVCLHQRDKNYLGSAQAVLILLASEPRGSRSTMLLPGSALCFDPFFFCLIFLSCQRLQSDWQLSFLGLIFRLACYRNVKKKRGPPVLLSRTTNEHRLSFMPFHHRTDVKIPAPQREQEPCLLSILFVLMELRVPRAKREYCGQSCCTNDLSLAF